MQNFQKLSRSEMKNVKGGVAIPATCSAKCLDGTSVSCSGANCNALDADGNTDGSCSAGGQTPKNCGAL
jgi:hypothetical protein